MNYAISGRMKGSIARTVRFCCSNSKFGCGAAVAREPGDGLPRAGRFEHRGLSRRGRLRVVDIDGLHCPDGIAGEGIHGDTTSSGNAAESVPLHALDKPRDCPLNREKLRQRDKESPMRRFERSILCSLMCCGMVSLPDVIPEAVAQDMSQYYTVMHPDEFAIDWKAFYETMNARTADVRNRYPHHLDLAYGDDPKQRLDLYLPEGEVSGAPVFLFLHGGGFREGDRAQYGAVAEPFLTHGIISAVASYRLTGDGFHYPDQTHDTRSAIKWLYENIEAYGGDPASLYVGGHSAGAILSADVGVDRGWMLQAGIPASALKGIAPVSGPYDLRERGRAGERNAYAPTPELLERASPVLHVGNPAPAAVVAVGSLEGYQVSSMELVEKLEAAGSNATYLPLDGQDHKDTALSLADPDSDLFEAVLRMIAE
jgi:arylformamidase